MACLHVVISSLFSPRFQTRYFGDSAIFSRQAELFARSKVNGNVEAAALLRFRNDPVCLFRAKVQAKRGVRSILEQEFDGIFFAVLGPVTHRDDDVLRLQNESAARGEPGDALGQASK
jgi:hypothetical protein